MKTFHWRHTDWNARNFIFSIGQEIIGQLTFSSSFTANAMYTDKEANVRFTQKSFWDKDVVITQNGTTLGEIKFKLFGVQTLTLVSGERFTLSSNFWGKNVYWKNEREETVIEYQQATMSSMGKGQVTINKPLNTETEKLLLSSGLFTRQLLQKRVAVIIIIMIPILAASRK